MAHRKAGGSTQHGRDSISKRLGVKIFGNQKVKIGNIILRQRGTKFHAAENVQRCGDDTLMALVDGHVVFSSKKVRDFTGALVTRRYVSVTKSDTPIEIKPRKTGAKKAGAKLRVNLKTNEAGKKKGAWKVARKPNMRKTVRKHLVARIAKKAK